MEDQGIGCGAGWRGWEVEFGPGLRGEREAWERWWNVGEMSVERQWDIGGMSCTEKWRDRVYEGEINRSKVQEIWGLEGVGGVGTRA